jgi:hypothetical protein
MVEYIEIFDRRYPIRLGYYVMKKVKEKTGMSFAHVLSKVDESQEIGNADMKSIDTDEGNIGIEIHETILWASLQMGAFAEDQKLDLEKEQVPMILDLCFSDYLDLFSSDKFFPDQEDMEVEAEDGGKKPKRTNKAKK